MNERIQKLAEQAGAYFGGGATDYFGDYLPPYMSITDVDLEKFAELIVKECAGIADSNDNGSSDEWDKCARGISRDIKLTFGVEE